MDDHPPSSYQGTNDNALAFEQYLQDASCFLCRKSPSSTHGVSDEFEPRHVCGDCKFLLDEDIVAPAAAYRRNYGRSHRFSSSESFESIFSQRSPHMMNGLRENQLNASQQEFHSVNGDVADCSLQFASSHTTPSGSRRWRWALSDTESEGLENFASHYGDSESNASLSRYRFLHVESDNFSFSAYGGDSDASVDRRSIMDARTLMFHGEYIEIDSDSDTDIDPMHVGVSLWESDYEEIEDEGEDMDNQRERLSTEAEEEDSGNQFQNFLSSRMRDRWETFAAANIFTNLEELDLHFNGRNTRDYLNSRGFEILLENIVENGISRRGAPPASVSFINNLPQIEITEEQEKSERLTCAICKDVLAVGTKVNQLPCCHLYHPSCILPWLSARNSCPLCRYELPTDDKDYEDGKRNLNSRLGVREIVQNTVDDNVSDTVGEDEGHEFDQRGHQGGTLGVNPDINSTTLNCRGRWFFLSAAPIVSLVGIAFVLWFGNPIPTAGRTLSEQNRHQLVSSERENRSRRWWCIL